MCTVLLAIIHAVSSVPEDCAAHSHIITSQRNRLLKVSAHAHAKLQGIHRATHGCTQGFSALGQHHEVVSSITPVLADRHQALKQQLWTLLGDVLCHADHMVWLAPALGILATGIDLNVHTERLRPLVGDAPLIERRGQLGCVNAFHGVQIWHACGQDQTQTTESGEARANNRSSCHDLADKVNGVHVLRDMQPQIIRSSLGVAGPGWKAEVTASVPTRGFAVVDHW